MDDRLHAVGGRCIPGGVPQVALHQLHPGGLQRGRLVLVADERLHVVASLLQLQRDGAADVAGPAGDEHLHRALRKGGRVSLRWRAPGAKREVQGRRPPRLQDDRRSDCIVAYAPSPPVRSETALGVCLTPTRNTFMCPECFGFVTSRGVSLSGLMFATDLPRGLRGSDRV